MKLEKRRSTMLTLILCLAVTVGLVLLTVTLPWVWRWLIAFFDHEQVYHTETLALMYIACVLGDMAAVMIVSLMVRVLSGKVFTTASVALLRGVSWCCMLVSPVFFAVGCFYVSMFVPAFVALFAGLALRVVKNVIEEATAIKEENDLTV